MEIITTKSFSPISNTCKLCSPKNWLSFNFKSALHEPQETTQLAKALVRIKPLAFGYLMKCPECNEAWYLDWEESLCHRIPPERLPLIERWNETKPRISSRTYRSMKKIGATERDLYGNGKGRIKIPCKALVAGRWYDPSLLIITRNPPLESWQENVLIPREFSIGPTELALPYVVRHATTQAPETSMGFSPTCIVDQKGRYFTLNWTTEFLFEKGVASSEVSLCSSPKPLSIAPIPESKLDKIWYVYVHWFSGCERLVRAPKDGWLQRIVSWAQSTKGWRGFRNPD